MTELVSYLPGIFLIYGVFLLQNATPGPNVLAVAGISMAHGKTSGLAVSVGVAAGTLTWSTASVVGLAALIASYGQLLYFIKIMGGLYLFYLAYKSLRSALSQDDLSAAKMKAGRTSLSGLVARGYLLNMTNPKAAFGWIAIVSLGMDTTSPAWVLVAIIVGTTTLSLMVHVAYTRAFSTPKMVTAYAKARRPIQAMLGGLFAYAGFNLLSTRLS